MLLRPFGVNNARYLNDAKQNRFLNLLATSALVAIVFIIPGCHAGPKSRSTPAPKPPQQVDFSSDASSDQEAGQAKTESLTALFLKDAPGNCILITTPAGKNVMIDAAPAGAEQDLLTRIHDAGIARLDYVIATCPTGEHIGCLPTLLGGIPFGVVYTPGCNSPTMGELERAVKAGGGVTKTVRAGAVVHLDGSTTLEVLAPDEKSSVPARPTESWYENHSLIFRIKYKTASILFTGDMGPDERKWMDANAVALRSTILTGLHHGDRRVSDLEFIHNVMPAGAVLMCHLHNSQGYPHREALDSMKSAMTRLYRTDLNSEVKLQILPNGQVSVLVGRSATDHEMGLVGSELKGELPASEGINIENTEAQEAINPPTIK